MAIINHEYKLINYHKSTSDSLSVPSLMIEKKARNEAVEYQVRSNFGITKAVIAGYEVICSETTFSSDFSSDAINTPSLFKNSVTNSTLIYDIMRNNVVTGTLIVGYEVTRFGVPMIRQYVNTGGERRATISPAVPGAQYRITAWALGESRRSATPAVVDATKREARHAPTVQY